MPRIGSDLVTICIPCAIKLGISQRFPSRTKYAPPAPNQETANGAPSIGTRRRRSREGAVVPRNLFGALSMSVDALGSNSSSSTLELLKELREAKKAMEASVQSGDIQGAQQNLATIQRDTQTLQAGRGTSDGPQDSNPYRSVLK